MLILAGVLLYASAASASFVRNINYLSPSSQHPGLGVSIHKVGKRSDPSSGFQSSDLNFTHGVASGDPQPSTVILWTRVAPQEDDDASEVTVSGTVPLYDHSTDSYVNASTAPVCVAYIVAMDNELHNVVDNGEVWTSSDIDWTVKVQAKNLSPFTTYYYRFNVCGSNNLSPVGRTKTTPEQDDNTTSNVQLAVYSCSNFPFGFFNAYGSTVRKDNVDYVVHLGDYIYEYGNGAYGNGTKIGRIPQPDKTIFSLYDYRKRYATYRTDLDLLDIHRYFPFISVWDDHEIADNTWRDGSAQLNNTENSFIADGGISVDQRKMNAVRAYFEWMPIGQVDMDDNLRIWRSFSIGKLFDLIMLDTRQYDRSITDSYWNTDYIHKISNDASRSLMGPRQENWFYNQLIASQQRGAAWRVVGSQIVFSRLDAHALVGNANPFNYDSWDGYLANRNRTLETLYANNINNNIVLAGDSHASWVSDLAWIDNVPYNSTTGDGAIGVEFAGSAVTSPSVAGQNLTMPLAKLLGAAIIQDNDEVQWQDLYYRGYFTLNITQELVTADFFGIPNLTTRNPMEIKLASFDVKTGENKLARNPTVGGGVAEIGNLRGGKIIQTDAAVDTTPRDGNAAINDIIID